MQRKARVCVVLSLFNFYGTWSVASCTGDKTNFSVVVYVSPLDYGFEDGHFSWFAHFVTIVPCLFLAVQFPFG
jgi:hypothetical protein